MSKPSYERDPERGNGQLEAGVPVGAEVSEGFSGVFFPDDFFAARGFFTGASFAVAGFFAAAFSADLLEGLAFFSGAGFLSDASFLATVLLADAEIFFSGFFSAFLGVFFSGFFSAFFSTFFSVFFSAALAGSLEVFLAATSFLASAFSCVVAEATFLPAGFFSSFFSAFSEDSLVIFLAETSFLVAGFFTAVDFSSAGFFAADFLVVAISTSRLKLHGITAIHYCNASSGNRGFRTREAANLQ